MPRLVISNTSPLLYLHRLHLLDLLYKLYQQITVPQAVIEELRVGASMGEDVPDVVCYSWMQVRTVRVPELIGLLTDLGAGEAEVLALALEERGSLVILDDDLARRVGKTQNLQITGTAGILVKAKAKGYVPAVAPLLESLLSLGFWLSNDVKRTILRQAQEDCP
jgi:predicted nucleic acid-binding protein